MIRTITATQYVTPLREGGSLPAIVEGDDDGTYVLKFRGAGQGVRALIAELVSGEIARLLGLPVPEIVFADLDPRMARTEPDAEIQDLLRRSEGLNLALDYLPGSIAFDPLVDRAIADKDRLASKVVWFDAFVTNVDRTARNSNLLVWHRKLWLIDHGASLFFHHAWDDYLVKSRSLFPQVKDHVLLRWAGELEEIDAEIAALLTEGELARIVDLIPESWLDPDRDERAGYREYFKRRLEGPREWVEEAARARSLLV
jgi:hypothetical protein